MTKQEAFLEINKLQDEYISQLVNLMNSSDYEMIKQINFTSPTGTGKTKMMSKLINKFPDYYFIITTLSKGQLHLQIKENLKKDCKFDNFTVYGSADYKINTKLQAKDIISKIPEGKKCIWLRDEGHIRTNKFEELLSDKCFKVINFSATNQNTDIQCSFTQTMMLRTVNQSTGTPKDAIKKLLEIKEKHKNVPDYNPCGIFRCISGDETLYNEIITLCQKYNLKYIDITEDTYNMAEICEDDNEYDVIINKFKIVEGIDIRRAHVLYMDNQPSNNATTIQVIGRCRRNALLYRDDIDILSPENEELLKNTRECFVFYNVKSMKIDTDIDGELQYAFCNHISCQEIKEGSTIQVTNGQLPNGLFIIELEGQTGTYTVEKDEETGFNIIKEKPLFYNTEISRIDDNYIYVPFDRKIHVNNLKFLEKNNNFYNVAESYEKEYEFCQINEKILETFDNFSKNYTNTYLKKQIEDICIDNILKKDVQIGIFDVKKLKLRVETYIKNNTDKYTYKPFSYVIKTLGDRFIQTSSSIKTFKDVLSKDELLLLQNKCIDLKEEGKNEFAIEQFIKSFIDAKSKYDEIKYKKEKESHLEIDGLIVPEMTEKEGQAYVIKYLKEHRSEEYFQDFCDLLLSIENKYDAKFWKLSRLCSEEEILKIQLTCIAAKYERFSDDEIEEYLFDIIEKRKNFDLNKDLTLSEKVSKILIENEVSLLIDDKKIVQPFIAKIDVPGTLQVNEEDVKNYFENIDKQIKDFKKKGYYFVNSQNAVDNILESINTTKKNLEKNIVEKVIYNLKPLFINITDEEKFLLDKKCLTKYGFSIPTNIKDKFNTFLPYDKIYNDKESATIGTDLMHQIKLGDNVSWIESKSVSAKIGSFNKLSAFLSKKYKDEIKTAKALLPKSVDKKAFKNSLNFDKRSSSIISYCVEYYSKYLVYGDSFLGQFLIDAQKEAGTAKIDKFVLVRACMLKYKEMMVRAYGQGAAMIVKNITIETLIKKYEKFVDKVVELGEKTAAFVNENLYDKIPAQNNIDPNLSLKHIAGLADYITKDTILDIKVKGYIDEKMVKQVLAYHYMSTKRSDLDIKNLIIFDALSQNFIKLNVA